MEEGKIDGRSREARALRPPMRSEEPRRDAAERAKAIMEHIGTFGESADEFSIDPSIVPDGWSYEWKHYSVMGQIDPSRQIELARKGWEAVPTSRHPEMMPGDTSERNIVRKGLQLMERPTEITELAKKHERRAATDQMRSKKEQLESAPAGTFERMNKDQSMARVKTDFRPMAIPD